MQAVGMRRDKGDSESLLCFFLAERREGVLCGNAGRAGTKICFIPL